MIADDCNGLQSCNNGSFLTQGCCSFVVVGVCDGVDMGRLGAVYDPEEEVSRV